MQQLCTSDCTHAEHSSLRSCSSGTTLSAKFCVNQGSTRGQTHRRYMYISRRSDLHKWGSWLSGLCKAVDTIPNAGPWSPQGRQSGGKIRSGLKPIGTSCQTDTWVQSYRLWHWWQGHPAEARALPHRAKHTHLAQESEKLTGSRGTQSNCRPSWASHTAAAQLSVWELHNGCASFCLPNLSIPLLAHLNQKHTRNSEKCSSAYWNWHITKSSHSLFNGYMSLQTLLLFLSQL